MVALKNLRPGGGGLPFDTDDVFDRQWNTRQRRHFTRSDSFIGLMRLFKCAFSVDMQEGVEGWVMFFNPGEHGFGKRHAGGRALLKLLGGLGEGEVVERQSC